jgi:pyrroloquinoline quinone biosynthesis protein D
MTIGDDKVFSLSKSVSFQPLGQGEGAVVLLVESGDIFTCNDTTSAFLAVLDGSRTFEASMNLLADQFKVDRSVLRTDLQQLAANLVEQGVIVDARTESQ